MQLAGDGFGPVAASHASTYIERLQGLRAITSLPALLIDASSVHTFGMDEAIAVIGLDREMRVIATRIVAPNRVVWLRGASRILEIPDDISIPPVGLQLGLAPHG